MAALTDSSAPMGANDAIGSSAPAAAALSSTQPAPAEPITVNDIVMGGTDSSTGGDTTLAEETVS